MSNEAINVLRNLAFVETVDIYDVDTGDLLFCETEVSKTTFLKAMVSSSCFDHSEFAYVEFESETYFLLKRGQYVLLVKLEPRKIPNQVILEHKSRQLLDHLQ